MAIYHAKRLLMFILIGTLAIATVFGNGILSGGRLEHFEQEFRRVEKLHLSSGSINIEVVQTDRNYRIEADLNSRRKVNVSDRGGSIDITISRVTGLPTPTLRESITLYLPDGIELSIDSGSGNVTVSEIRVDDIEVDLGSGNITFAGVHGNMDASAGSGNIEVEESDGSKHLNAGSGRISVVESDGSISAETGSGSQEYTHIDGDISVDAGSGRVKLEDVQGAINISVASGSIRGEDVHLTDDSFFKSNSGSIDITLTNPSQDLSFSLDAGSGALRIDGTRSSDSLLIGTGKIQVIGRSGSGSQRYRTE